MRERKIAAVPRTVLALLALAFTAQIGIKASAPAPSVSSSVQKPATASHAACRPCHWPITRPTSVSA